MSHSSSVVRAHPTAHPTTHPIAHPAAHPASRLALGLSFLAAALLPAGVLAAQDGPMGMPMGMPMAMRPAPQITITAQGEVQVTPDRARISLGVETEAKTAQEAAQANAALQSQILAAVRRAGIPAADIRTTGYNVAPRQQYLPETRTWRVDGYRVSNIVVVTVDTVSRTGAVIDAALGAGANRVAGITFEIKDASAAREQAMTQAVERARREADIAARAAGGSVVGLIELNVNSYEQSPRPMVEMAMMRSDAASTSVSEGTQSVVVSVTTRWEYGPPK